MIDLFGNEEIKCGAEFSADRKYRYALWRIWDESLPMVMFIGLNPSTANETDNDPTIKSVIRIAKNNGYGGVYMMNCFPYISTDPKKLLQGVSFDTDLRNAQFLKTIGIVCSDIIFAWGNFKEVEKRHIDAMVSLFPNAKALHINKNGSPKHPLYCKSDIKPILFINSLSTP